MEKPGRGGTPGVDGQTCTDQDGDGYCNDYTSMLDCDDADPARHPGATELCNGKDDDCDGKIDNGAAAACQFTCDAPPGGCETMTAIVAGERSVCALSSSGRVYCWGSNAGGGLGSPELSNSTLPVVVPGVSNATALVGSGLVACAILSDEAVCWGGRSAIPFSIALPPGTKQVAVGNEQIYALLNDGSVQSRLLLATTYLPARFVEVTHTPQAAIAANVNSFCMLDSQGALSCTRSTPDTALKLTGVTTVSVTLDDSVCYTMAGELHCTTLAGDDQVIAGNGSALGVVKSTGFACAFAASGKAACWSPGGPTTIADAQQLAVGTSFGCVLRKGGRVSCWGSRDNGALGDGLVNTTKEAEPIDVGVGSGLELKGSILLRSPALGACDSLSDVSKIAEIGGTGTVHALFRDCGAQCKTTLDSAACFATCAKNPGLSVACFGCFSTLASCTGATCYAAFKSCAGFDIDFLPVVFNAPRFECAGADCMKGAQLGEDCKTDEDCLSGACSTLPQFPGHSVCVSADGGSCYEFSAYCACHQGYDALGEATNAGYCGDCRRAGRISSTEGQCFRTCTPKNYCEDGQQCESFSNDEMKYCK
jgi:alpha-tubulin suppressor-like RCC1 family protein